MTESDRETLYFGGDVYTVDEGIPRAEALAVRGGLIAEVGTLEQCRAALGDECEEYDLGGRAVLPGFIDTHLHLLMLVYFSTNLDLHGVSSLEDLRARLRLAAEDKSEREWVVGLSFDEQGMDVPRLPTRHDLDAACPGVPVVVVRRDGHTVIAGSRAIELAGVSESTPDPAGGAIDREPGGYPTGVFREEASMIIRNMVPLPGPERLFAGADRVFSTLSASGITSAGAVLQAGVEGPAGAEGAFEIPLVEALLDRVPVSLYGILIASEPDQVDRARESALDAGGVGEGHRVGGIKIFADGTFGSHTAFMDEPYSDAPGERGFLSTDPEEIYRRMSWAHRAGLQVAVHAIGDAANRTVVGLYDRLLREHPRPGHRHRIEHASQLDPETIGQIARLGLVVSTQPMFIQSDSHWLEKRIGRERLRHTYPFRSLLDAGVRLAGASDGPVESVNVLRAMECCITREGFETGQRITAEEAVRMYTVDAAYAQFDEGVKGTLTGGKRADIVVLSENPVSAQPDRVGAISVDRTVVGGAVVFDASP